MTGWILFDVATPFAALGLLTVFKSPERLDWRLAVMASQYGHAIAIVPLTTGILALVLPGSGGAAAVAAVAMSAAAFALLVQPCVQAVAIGRGLPKRLEEQFGFVAVTGRPFSLFALFRGSPAPVPRTTWTFSGALQLDFYPAIGRSPAPCVILIHGGGWDNGDRVQIPQFNHWLARGGFAVAAISYRLAPDGVWPAQRDDVSAAIAFIKEHAASWGVDASRLVLLGRSAGGQIAEACAYAFRDPSIRGVAALYAPADMHFAWAFSREDDVLKSPTLLRKFLGGTPDTAREAYDSASGIRLVGPGSPPTLLVHGTIDTLVWYKQSTRLAARLAEEKIPHVLVSLPWATHALEFNLSSPAGQLTAFAVTWFLGAVCR